MADPVGPLVIIDSLKGEISPSTGGRDEFRKDLSEAGALIEGGYALGRPLFTLRGSFGINASSIFGEIGRLCERNFIHPHLWLRAARVFIPLTLFM